MSSQLGNFSSNIDRHFLTGDGIDPDLAAEEEQVPATAKWEVKYPGILQKELPLFRIEEFVWREVELFRVYVRVGKVSIDGEVRYEVGPQAQLHIDAAGVERAGSRR